MPRWGAVSLLDNPDVRAELASVIRKGTPPDIALRLVHYTRNVDAAIKICRRRGYDDLLDALEHPPPPEVTRHEKVAGDDAGAVVLRAGLLPSAWDWVGKVLASDTGTSVGWAVARWLITRYESDPPEVLRSRLEDIRLLDARADAAYAALREENPGMPEMPARTEEDDDDG